MSEQVEPTSNSQQARLAALYEVSSQLGASLDLSEVLNQVMDAIIQLTGAERGFLMLFDEVTGELQTMAARNVDQKTIDDSSMKISRTVVERATNSGEGILTSNAQEDERFSSQQSVVGYQLRSIMCAPLRARGRVIGAAYVDNRLFTGVFQQDDLDLLITFANQAAIAIENARLFTQTDQALNRRVEELTIFQRIDQQLNKSLELQRVLSLALDWAINLTNADSGSIGLLVQDEDQGEPALRLLARREPEGAAAGDAEKAIVPVTHPVLAQILAGGESVLSRELSAGEAIDGTPSAIQLAVPVRRDGRVTGLITLESDDPGAIDEEDVAFVERLADRAAVAIKNARLYEDVQAANQAKSDFISIVSHELRLPMTSIKGYTDLLASGMAGELNTQQHQFLGVIRRNMERMSTLIRDLADINRIESGRMKFENKDFVLQAVIDDVVENLREAIAGREQTLTVEMAEGETAVHADPTRISQILSNLVSNAHKYTPDGGQITLQVAKNKTHAVLSVIDNGVGISEADQAKLFTQFFRAESPEVREQSGWGLGLSIVKKMVQAQGGEIDVESELGEGSTFTFSVPLATMGA